MNARAKYTANMVRLHRQIGTAKKPRKKLPAQLPPRAIEREYAKAIRNLIREVISELKFAMEEIKPLLNKPRLYLDAASFRNIPKSVRMDAPGDGKKIRDLADKARSNLKSKMNTTRLEAIVEKFGERTSDFQRQELRKQAKAALGMDVLGTERGLRAKMTEFVSENVSLIKGIPERLIGDFEQIVSRAMNRGYTVKELSDELDKRFDLEEGRAARIARDQVGTFYGQLNDERQQSIGVTRFIWRTVQDEKVREEHAEREGETYEYEDPPDGELPGEPINCRCYAEPVLSDLFGGGEDE